MADLRNYVSDDGEYIIPVTWQVYATVTITGVSNLEEAYQVAQDYIDDLPLATNPDYIDGSFQIEIQDDQELLDAQNYAKYDARFENPDA